MTMQKSYFSSVWLVMLPMVAIILIASADTINPFHRDTVNVSKSYPVYKTINPSDSEARLKELARKCYPEKFKNVK